MKTFLKKIVKPLLAVGLSLSVVAVTGVAVSAAKKEPVESNAYYSPSAHYEVSDTASELASYYSSISDSDTGSSLLSKLQSLNSSKRKRTIGYGGIGTNTSGACIYTDYDLNSTATDSNGQTYGTKVASFYTKTAATGWNREHMWPNSHGGNHVEADILHTRPTIQSENSSRGNSFYVEGKNSSSAGWDPYTAGYDAEVRGECARVILYCVVAYPSFTLSGADSHSTSNSNKDNMMGNMNTLIKWHFDYMPNVYEMNRNNGAEYLQGNRNPFVDHPEYVAKIWSNFNSTVSTLCTNNSTKYSNWTPGAYANYGENTPVNTTGVFVSSTSKSMTVGDDVTISATSSNNSSITWTTSDSSVVSISSSSASSGTAITLHAEAAGNATITAKATIGGTQYTASCTVTVSESGGSGEGGEGGESGDNVTITVSDIPSQYSSTSFTASGYSFGCSNIGNSYTSGSMQWKSGQGYMYNTSPISNISGIKINTSGGTFSGTIYTGSSSHPTSGTSYSITNGNTVNISGSPSYFTIKAGTVSGGAKCGDITIYRTASKTLSSISVSTAPTKTTYTAGEYFDPTGLVITRTYSDSTSDTYTYANHTSEFSFSPSTSTALTTSNVSVTITYGGKSTSQAITVNAAAKTLSSISISGQTTSFTVDDTFSFGGTVTAHFSDSSSSNVTTSATFSGYNMSVAGNYTVTVSYTYSGTTKTTTYSITVQSSGGSGGGSSGSQRISANTSSTYYETGDIYPTGSTSSASASCDAFSVSWLKNGSSNSIANSYAEIRVYASHSFTITPKDGYTITSIVITANNTTYANAVGGSSLNNCTKDVDGSTVTLTPTNGASAVGFTNTAQSRINYIVVNYNEPSGSTEATLSSISVSTAPTKTTYTAGENFDPTGLVITRNYSDSTSDTYAYAGHTSEFTFSPTTSAALTTGDTSVTISYGGKSTTQAITVNSSSSQTSTGTVTYTDLPTSYQTSTTERTAASGIKFIAYNLANYSSKMQFKASGGYFQTTEALPLTTVTINNRETNALTVYGSTNGTSFSTSITGTNDVYDLSGYKYVKIMKNGSGAAYCASIDIDYETSSDWADYFLANIGCTANGSVEPSGSWSTFSTKYQSLASADKTTLQNATGNVSGTNIEQAVRLYDYIVGKYGTTKYNDFIGRNPSKLGYNSSIFAITNGGSMTPIIVITSLASVAAIGALVFIKKRKED